MTSSQWTNRHAQIRTARAIPSLDTKKASFYSMSSLGSCLTMPFPFPFLCVGEVDKCLVYKFYSQAPLSYSCIGTDTGQSPKPWHFAPAWRLSLVPAFLKQVLVYLNGENPSLLIILMHYQSDSMGDPEKIQIPVLGTELTAGTSTMPCWLLKRTCERVSYPLIQLSIWSWLLQVHIFFRKKKFN